MRVLYVLCLGLFGTCMFGQGPIPNQSTPPRTPIAGLSSAAKLTSEEGQATVSDPQMSKPTRLVDAPSVTQQTTCTQNNGKPCPEWVHKLIGQYPPSSESEEFQPQRAPSSLHFWTYRGWGDPPLRTNKQVFRSKVFLATHIGGAIAMIVSCRTKNSGEDWGSDRKSTRLNS